MDKTVVEIAKSIDAIVLNERDQKVINWLKLSGTSPNHSAARDKHQPDTGNWILDSAPFKEWSETTHSSMWLHGIPGAGKSILCSTIIEHVF